jgi:type 1 glutamine amidotransferase
MRARRLLAISLAASLGGAAVLEAATPRKLLVVTVTKGYRHESIPTAEKVLGELATRSGAFTVDYARTDEELKAKAGQDGRAAYDGVVFANTSGELDLPDREQFLQWIEGGKAFVGFHACANTWQEWRPFVEMLGGEFDYHRDQAKVAALVDDPNHASTRAFPQPLEVFDEIYLFKSWRRDRVNMLLSMARHPNNGDPGYYPMAWTRSAGKGRVFYTAFGHRADVIESDWWKAHVLGGIRWALGLSE